MPKVVDRDEIRDRLAKSAWRVISRGGLDAATFRAIAQEAGVSLGAMQHYFKTQSDLFSFCLSLSNSRCAERIRGLKYPQERPYLDHLKAILYEVLPIDEERTVLAKVRLEFSLKSLYAPELNALREEMNENLRTVYSQALGLLLTFGIARDGFDQQLEVDHLYALIDGLTLRILFSPSDMSSSRVDEVLGAYLRGLCNTEKLRRKSPKPR
jgi:Transcriptional regulator